MKNIGWTTTRCAGCARWYRDLLAQTYGEIPTKYFESYISLIVGGIARVWVSKRKNDCALIEVKYVEEDPAEAADYLSKEGVAYKTKCDGKIIAFNVNLQQLKEKQSAHEWIVRKLAPSFLIQPARQLVYNDATGVQNR